MRGFPKHLNSKADYEFIREHFLPAEWVPAFQALLTSVNDWFYVKEMDTREEGIEDDTHKVVESQSDATRDEPKTIYIQYEYRQNPNAELFRYGYTVPEVEAIIRSGLAQAS